MARMHKKVDVNDVKIIIQIISENYNILPKNVEGNYLKPNYKNFL